MSYLTAMHQESEVLHQISLGSERAFAMLFNHYHQWLGVHIYKITKSEDLAAEVVNDVFLKIWLNRESLGEIENFPVYLYVISKNAALNCLKRVANEQAKSVDLDQVTELVSDTETAENDYRYMLIDEAIDRLSAQQKRAYLLSRHERLQYSEVAVRMNISKETVKKYLQTATESITSHIRKRLTLSILSLIHFFF
jgi:RNA polymerase sigma-70 factor (ECF subfamily)